MNNGQEIFGYEVLSTLGHGAHSTIYEVRDPNDHNIYALKRVIKESPYDQRFLDQAILEHDVANKMDHPTLRKSYKLIRQRDALLRTIEVLVIMEFIDGATLDQVKPDNLIKLCDICKQLTDGLREMHRTGLVHGDIKPNNILLTPRNEAKIIDFGQSCTSGTVKDRIQGTPDYIAPEQVLRRTIRPETDVFNLGATMYWILTDEHVPTLIPNRKAGPPKQKKKRRIREPSTINPEIPPALSRLVSSCVRSDPAKRPSSMTEVSDRLDLALIQLRRQTGEIEPAQTEVDEVD